MAASKRAHRHILRRGLFVLADWVLVGLFVVGYLASYLHPRYFWWGGIVAVFLPYLVAVLIPASLIVFLRFRRRTGLVSAHLVFLLAASVRFVHPARWLEPKDAMDEDFILMTLNAPRYPESEEVAEEVVRLVREHEPDLIGVQESITYARRSQPERLRAHVKLQRLIDEFGYDSPKPRDGPVGQTWTAWYQPVIGRVRILNQRQITYRYTENDIRPMRALRTEFEWQGRKAVHYNLHLHTYGEVKPWDEEKPRFLDLDFWRPYVLFARQAYLRRAWQAERLRKDIESETLPVLVSGDFNGTPHNWEYRHLARGLQDAFSEAGKGWGGTYHTRWPLVRIDFVLAGPEWEVVSASVPKSSRVLSDHRPLVASLRWRSAE